MTAAAGTEVGLYVDLVASVAVGDIIETRSGRQYGVTAVRVQARGKHAGRQHLRCVVLAVPDIEIAHLINAGSKVHRIRWYRRPGGGITKR